MALTVVGVTDHPVPVQYVAALVFWMVRRTLATVSPLPAVAVPAMVPTQSAPYVVPVTG